MRCYTCQYLNHLSQTPHGIYAAITSASQDSDGPSHLHSLVKAFTVRIHNVQKQMIVLTKSKMASSSAILLLVFKGRFLGIFFYRNM